MTTKDFHCLDCHRIVEQPVELIGERDHYEEDEFGRMHPNGVSQLWRMKDGREFVIRGDLLFMEGEAEFTELRSEIIRGQ